MLYKSSPWLFFDAKHEQDEEHHEAELLSAHQSSPKPDPLGHAEAHGKAGGNSYHPDAGEVHSVLG